MRHPVIANVMGRTPASFIVVTQSINMVVGLLYIACAALDWYTRATNFGEKGGPPPVRLWAEIVIDAPGVANSIIIILAGLCMVCAFGSINCDRLNLTRICSRCRYPASVSPPCSECGHNRTTRAGDMVRRRWAWCSAIGMLAVIWTVGSADLVDSLFDVIRWFAGEEYAGRPMSQWPLGLELATVPAVLLWFMLTILVVMECVALQSISR